MIIHLANPCRPRQNKELIRKHPSIFLSSYINDDAHRGTTSFFIYGNIINKTDELLFQFTPNGHTVGFYLTRQNFKPPSTI